ncbi:hypothetical protein PT2222_10426 [Paraburkholderia tropica]
MARSGRDATVDRLPRCAVDGADHRGEYSLRRIVGDAHAVAQRLTAHPGADEHRRAALCGARSFKRRDLHAFFRNIGERCRDGLRMRFVDLRCRGNRDVAAFEACAACADHRCRPLRLEIFAFEQRADRLAGDFHAGGVRDLLHGVAEFDLDAARRREAHAAFEQIRRAALARLAVHADHRVVAAAEIGGIDRQIGHFPDGVGLLKRETLADRVLMRARKRREHEVARVRMARMHGQLIAALDHTAHGVDVRKIEARIDALRVEIHRERDEIDVAGAFAVAEETAFDTVRAREHGHFGGGHGGAAVVMRMHGEHDAVAIREVAVHPLDLVGVDVGHRGFDGRREIHDHLVIARRAPRLGDGVADFAGERELGHAERFRRILVGPVRLRAGVGVLADHARAVHGERLHFFLRLTEHDLAERRADRVVKMHDRARCAIERLERAGNQIFTRLHEHFDRHVVGNALFVDELAHEIEVGLRSGRKADFDFLEADLHEHFEEFGLLLDAHRLDERLVAVAQVGAHPDRRAFDRARRPFAAVQTDGGERAIFFGGITQHDGPRSS